MVGRLLRRRAALLGIEHFRRALSRIARYRFVLRPIDHPEHPRSQLGDPSAPPMMTTTTTKTADTRAACLVATLAIVQDAHTTGACTTNVLESPGVAPGEPPHQQDSLVGHGCATDAKTEFNVEHSSVVKAPVPPGCTERGAEPGGMTLPGNSTTSPCHA